MNSHLTLERRNINWFVKFLIISIPIVLGIILIFSHFNFQSIWGDEIYQAICIQNYKEAPIGILTFFIGKLWTDLFGFTLINLRILTLIESILAIGVGAIYCFYATKNAVLSSSAFLLGCILMKYGGFPLYNWDSGTYLFDSLAILILLTIINRPTLIRCFLLGVATGLMTLGRLPSGIFLALSLVIIYLAYRYKKFDLNFTRIILCTISGWLITVIIILCIAYGSPIYYISSLADGNIVSGHSIAKDKSYLLKRLWELSLYCSQKWVPALGCMLIAVLLPKLRSRLIQLSIFMVWLGFCLVYALGVANSSKALPFALGGDAPVAFGLIIAYPVFCVFTNRQSKPIVILHLWAIVALLFSILFGSDAYFERAIASFLTPFLLAILWQIKFVNLKKFIIYSIGLCIFIMGSMLMVYFYKLNRMIKLDETITLSEEPFQGLICTDEMMYQELKNTNDAITYLQNKKIRYAYGGNRNLIELRYGKDNGPSFHEFHAVLTNQFGWLRYKETFISNVDAVVYPISLYDSTIDEVIEDLRDEGFTDIDTIGRTVIVYREGY